jgi:shikimate kinase
MKKLKDHIFLIGFMGSGKTSTTQELSRMLGVKAFDTDLLVEEHAGMEIPKIFATQGEEVFRSMETEVLQKLQSSSPGVVSCGGGVVLRPENVRLMKQQGRILLLQAAPETIYERVKDSTNRPLLNGHMDVEYIRGLMAERETAYREAADLVVDTDGLSPRAVAEQIMTLPDKKQNS